MSKKKLVSFLALAALVAAQFGASTIFAASPNNSTPVIFPADPALTAVAAGASMSFKVDGFDFDTVDVLTYSAQDLPAGATLDAATGQFAWTPTAAQVGDFLVTFFVSDGIDSASAQETLKVTAPAVPNNPPFMFEIAPQSVSAGNLIELTLTSIDPDGDALTYGAEILPIGATLDTAGGIFRWTPTAADAGSHFIAFTVTDGKDTNSQTVRIDVNAASPVNNAPVLNAIPSQDVAEGDIVRFTLSATDADADTLTFSAVAMPVGATLDATSGSFRWPTNTNDIGQHEITFTVTDGTDTDTQTVQITVNEIIVVPVNNAPQMVQEAPKTVNVGEAVTIDLAATDLDNDVLTFSSANLPQGASLDQATGHFSWTPTAAQAGVNSITFSVSDGAAIDTKTVQITVNEIIVVPVNNAPQMTQVAPIIVNTGETVSINLIATDLDNDVLTFSSANLPQGASLNQATGHFSWTPTAAQAGVNSIAFTVSDGTATDTQTVQIIVDEIIVAPVNIAPQMVQEAPKTVNVGEAVTINLSATDADNDTLTFSSANLPEGAGLNPATGQFNWTPTAAQVGVHSIAFTVSDGIDTDTKSVQITINEIVVTPVNHAPQISQPAAVTSAYDRPISLRVSATDADNDAISFSSSNLPLGATLDSATGNFSWTPARNQIGTYSINLKVSDNELTAETVLSVTVVDKNNNNGNNGGPKDDDDDHDDDKDKKDKKDKYDRDRKNRHSDERKSQRTKNSK